MAHRRYQESEKRKWVSRFNGEHLNAAAFCRKHNLPYGSFMEWKRRYRTESSKSTALACQRPEFIELTVERPSSQVRGVAALPVAELSLGPGMVLRVYAPNHSGE